MEDFFFSSRRRHTISYGDWSSDVCSSDLPDGRVRRKWRLDTRRPGRCGTSRARRYRLRPGAETRSEERRVGKERRTPGESGHEKDKDYGSAGERAVHGEIG